MDRNPAGRYVGNSTDGFHSGIGGKLGQGEELCGAVGVLCGGVRVGVYNDAAVYHVGVAEGRDAHLIGGKQKQQE